MAGYLVVSCVSFAAGYFLRHIRRRWPTDTRQLLALASLEEASGHYLAHMEKQQSTIDTIVGMYDAVTSAEMELRS